MIVTAWNNGKNNPSGSGYGFKVDIKDRDIYFNKDWENVYLELEGAEGEVAVNINKKSFWTPKCRELISKDVGIWLIKNKKAPWPRGHPPKVKMEHISNNRFKVKFIKTDL